MGNKKKYEYYAVARGHKLGVFRTAQFTESPIELSWGQSRI